MRLDWKIRLIILSIMGTGCVPLYRPQTQQERVALNLPIVSLPESCLIVPEFDGKDTVPKIFGNEYKIPKPLILPVPPDTSSVPFWTLDEEQHALFHIPHYIVDTLRPLEGAVFVQILIGHDGSVIYAYVEHSSGHVELDNEALRTVMQWQFTPPRLKGKPVQCWISAPVRFKVQQ